MTSHELAWKLLDGASGVDPGSVEGDWTARYTYSEDMQRETTREQLTLRAAQDVVPTHIVNVAPNQG